VTPPRPAHAACSGVCLLASAALALVFAATAIVDARLQRAGLLDGLAREGEARRKTFEVALASLEQQMLTLATMIAGDPRTQTLLREGRRAVAAEGGGAGGAEAARLRAALHEHVEPAWQHMQQHFGVKQLQFHLTPGSLSFLRLHAPTRFGDRMDGLRHLIEDVDRDRQPRAGIETGRVYTGMRGAVPVWSSRPDGGRDHVATLEAGTTFGAQLDWLDRQSGAGFAILLRHEHVDATVWEAYRTPHDPPGMAGYLLEASSRPIAHEWVAAGALPTPGDVATHTLLTWAGHDYHVTLFPLRDYLGGRDPARPPIGAVVAWRDVDAVMAQHAAAQHRRMLTFLLGYALAQALLLWLLYRTRHHLNVRVDAAVAAEQQAQQALARLSRRNEQLLMAVGEGVYGVDRNGRGIFINHAALTMLGLTEAEVLGADQHRLFHHHRRDGRPYPPHECPVHRTLVDGVARRIDDEWFWRKDGSGFAVRLTVTPTEEDGGPGGAVVVFQDITERKQREHELLRLATTDALTGIANRRCLLEHVEQELARFRRSRQPGALLMLDLDHFKRINDRHGHAAGDAVLKHFAALMQSHLRRIDFVGRLGGEEFVIVLADTPASGARVFAERLCEAVAAQALVTGDGELRYTVSIGVAPFADADAGTHALLARADAALYRAKQNGRNRVEFADAPPAAVTQVDTRRAGAADARQ
jgi:diguanylate cyclase (GGDEF)-like protein/PAS domain S-box-containing protein